ncbi:MAG TPA: TetR family transcriptional regulator [Solirubrobacteraceae bacterium]|nr:TetR family transcriptional regulator [Solirubrobacteraceae bacterium]
MSAQAAPAPYREAARELLRDTLFDAARTLLADRPWAQISMAEVARAAGVSRQTLYAQFGSRDEFAQQFVIREGARFLAEVERAIHAHLDDPTRAIRAGLEAFLVSAAEDPLVRLLLADDGTGGMLPLVTTRSQPVLDWADARLCAVMHEGFPGIRAEDAELLADVFVRLALSYVTMPPRRTPAASAAAAAALLAPYVERVLAAADR